MHREHAAVPTTAGTVGGDVDSKPVIMAPKKGPAKRALPPAPTPVTQAPLYLRNAPRAQPVSAEAVAKVWGLYVGVSGV